jgi:hypothetical protein
MMQACTVACFLSYFRRMGRGTLHWKWLAAGFTLLYLLLPNANPSSDAVGYAATQRWDSLHFSPHHLLYHLFWALLLKSLFFLHDLNMLWLMQAGNSLVAGGILLLCGALMQKIRPEYTRASLLSIGSSFGLMRFATENETYMLPLFFGLLALWISQGKHRRKWIWTAWMLALSMLFHQSYVFWWLAFVGYAYKSAGRIPALIVLSAMLPTAAVYQLAAWMEGEPLWRFIFHDVYEGGVQTSLSLRNVYMTPVSFLRSFLQLHGYMFWSWKQDGIWYIAASSASAALLLFAGLQLIRGLQKPSAHRLWRFFLLPAFGLHFLFAFYSEGNAEFMVMLPLLLVLGASACTMVKPRSLWFAGWAMLFWNLIHGLLPWHFRDFYGHEQLLHKLADGPPDVCLVSEEPVMMRNLYYYHFGLQNSNLILDSPEWAVSKGKSAESAIAAIDSVLKQPFRFVWYADYSRYMLNRAAFAGKKSEEATMNGFRFNVKDSLQNMNGIQYIYELERP